MDKIELSPFVTTSEAPPPRRRTPRRLFPPPRERRRRRSAAGGGLSMFIKLGICLGACALVLVLKWVDSPLTDKAVQTLNSAVDSEVDLDEMLGRLQFVHLPGILSVFSASTALEAPVLATGSYLIDNDRMAVFEAYSGDDVMASAGGTVLQTGADTALGNYVSIEQQNGLTVTYYGLAEVLVEVGQTVRKLDTLGSVDRNGAVCVSVYQDGRPLDPSDYFPILGK